MTSRWEYGSSVHVPSPCAHGCARSRGRWLGMESWQDARLYLPGDVAEMGWGLPR